MMTETPMPQNVRLTAADRAGLARLASEQSKSKGQVARDAIRWYLDHHSELAASEKDEKLSSVVYKCTDRIIAVITNSTNRIAALLVRAILDMNMVLMLFYRMLPEEKADDTMSKVYRMAVSRLQRKLSSQELDIKRMIEDGLTD
jgi:hypothetical protein